MKGYSTNDENIIEQAQNERSQNFIERFPEFNFKPSSLLFSVDGDIRKYYKKRVTSLISILVSLSILAVIIGFAIEGWDEDVFSAISFSLLISFIIIPCFIPRWKKRVKLAYLNKETDYYPLDFLKGKFRYYIVVKDAKFGVWDRKKNRFQIQAEYDRLSWKEPQLLLDASKDSDKFVITNAGQRLY